MYMWRCTFCDAVRYVTFTFWHFYVWYAYPLCMSSCNVYIGATTLCSNTFSRDVLMTIVSVRYNPMAILRWNSWTSMAISNQRGAEKDDASIQRSCPEVVRWNSWTLLFTKDTWVFSSLLFTVPSTSGFLRKPYSSPVLKILSKNRRNNKTRLYWWIAFCRTGNEGRKTRQKLESEETRFYAQKPRLKRAFKNSISKQAGLNLNKI